MGLLKLFAKLTRKKPDTSAVIPAKILRVSDYLSEKTIRFFSPDVSQQQILESLVGTLNVADPKTALKELTAREEKGATVITPGLAVPHARLTGLTCIVAALGICSAGVSYAANVGLVRLFLLFLSPQEKMREHLIFLAGVSFLFQQEGLVETLSQLQTPEAVIAQIRGLEAPPPKFLP